MFIGVTALRGKAADRNLGPSNSHSLDPSTEAHLCVERALDLEREVYGDCDDWLLYRSGGRPSASHNAVIAGFSLF